MLLIGFLLASAPIPQSIEDYCTSGTSGQPYTLCRAEWEFEQSDRRLNAQWVKSFRAVKARKGRNAANRLRVDQREWVKSRGSECEAIAAPTPTTQQGRNFVGCMAKMTDERTALLRAMTGKQ